MNVRMVNGKNLPQTTKLKNAIENNMSTDINLSKALISKIIQFGRLLCYLLSKIAGPL